MACSKMRRYLPAYHDGELDDLRRADVEKHLASCRKCQEELDRYAKGVQKIKSLVPPVPEPPPSEQVWERISQRLLTQNLPAFRRRTAVVSLGVAGAVLGIILLCFAARIWHQRALPEVQPPATVQDGMRSGWESMASRAAKWVVEKVDAPAGLVTVRVNGKDAPKVGSVLVLFPGGQGKAATRCRAVVKQAADGRAVCAVQPFRGLSAQEAAGLVKPGWRAAPE